jgi:probable rRNA maturation factor
VISVETADRQAQQQGHSLKTELAWLASHGCLHLLGWDHPDLESLKRMLNQQVTLLQAINLEITLEGLRAMINESEIVG